MYMVGYYIHMKDRKIEVKNYRMKSTKVHNPQRNSHVCVARSACGQVLIDGQDQALLSQWSLTWLAAPS